MPLQHTPWSPMDRFAARPEPGAFEDEDLALGWECALPALQVEAWEPAPASTVETVTGSAG